MICLLGRGLLYLTLAASGAGLVTGLAGGLRDDERAGAWARRMAYVSAGASSLATLLLVYALVVHDFSVSYVADVGSLETPPLISIVSLWSSLDGSMLFWAVVLAVYGAIFAWRTRHGDSGLASWAMAVLHGSVLFFGLLVAGEATPFALVDPVPSNGPGPNPLLQNHILMAIHPPTLYLGYVGMSVPFAMAVAALARRRLDAAWLASLRAWSLWVWAFLSLGILLGGWWSYEVLGWGGYWAWDPVENASLLPWLSLTAALHALLVTRRRGQLASFALSLLMLSFLFTVLGTFMTRSGIFNSVHSFTQSAIGPLFLGFLTLALLGCLLLLSYGVDRLQLPGVPVRRFGFLSRELSFLLAALLLLVLCFTVLLGTLYPLINQALRGSQVSVGAPYFNKMCLPQLMALLLLMGLGPALAWGRTRGRSFARRLALPVLAGLAAAGSVFLMNRERGWVPLCWGLAAFAAVISVQQLWSPVGARLRAARSGPWLAPLALLRMPRRLGAHITHLGVLMAAVAIAASSSWRVEEEHSLAKGESVQFHGYTLGFIEPELRREAHRSSQLARLSVFRGRRDLGELEPALNHYRTMSQALGTPAVLTRPSEDLYLTVVRIAADRVTIRAFLEPLVVWLWVGGLLAVLGALWAAWPTRGGRKPAQRGQRS